MRLAQRTQSGIYDSLPHQQVRHVPQHLASLFADLPFLRKYQLFRYPILVLNSASVADEEGSGAGEGIEHDEAHRP